MTKATHFLIGAALTVIASAKPSDLSFTRFAGSDLAPSPACLAVSPTGEVYVGVDMLGSLGKGAGKGRIVRLVDTNNDGVADKHTVFAEVDNPRGLISVGDKLYVIHTIIPADTGILTRMDLSVFEDKNGDGVADGPPKTLIQNISVPKHNQDRGADHTTNGMRMGIDGWIYIAVGDFGFVDAVGADGKKGTLLGGGVLRVRPDGTEMEMYTYGLRNIYNFAIDPYMNIFTRDNDNDGGGWNIRFSHHIQTGEYGYPILFKNFSHEIIPALADLGGGSGTGALFMDEPSWPAKYNQVPMMADWGRSEIFIHRVTPDGPTFTQEAEGFIKIPQPTALDVDGSGRLYLAAWAGAGYRGSSERGFVERAVPDNWTYKPFPDLPKLKTDVVTKGLLANSATTRLAAQQEILSRKDTSAANDILAIAKGTDNSLASRVAALYTYKQLLGADANPALLELAKDPALKEFALRALTDRLTQLDNVPLQPFLEGLRSGNARVRAASVVALGRLGKKEAAEALLAVAQPPAESIPAESTSDAPLFASGKISAKQMAEIDIDLTGVGDLYLVVEDGGDGIGGDHAGWFDPVFTRGDGTKIPLTELKWKSATQGWGTTGINKSPNGAPLVRSDGKPYGQAIGTHAVSVIHFEVPEGVVNFKATAGLATTANRGSTIAFQVRSEPPSGSDAAIHAIPNSAIVIPHLAVQALVRLRAVEASLAAIDGPSRDGALWALRLMHEPEAVDGLIKKFGETSDLKLQNKILATLARLYQQEAPYDGSWWWNTKPDTRGPYYKPVKWAKSSEIEKLFREVSAGADASRKEFITAVSNKNRMNLPGIGDVEETKGEKVQTIGEISIENVMLALDGMKGDPARGRDVLTTQACVACHSIVDGDPPRGPDLNDVGSRLSRETIAEAILKPDAFITESWVDLTTNDGTTLQGTLIEKTEARVVVRNIAGESTTLDPAEIKEIKTSASTLMAPHLLDALSLEQFVDVVDYLHSLK